MKRKVEKISKDIAERLSKWDCVDTIALTEAAEEDIINPYFFLSLDVYYSNEIPPLEERKKAFTDAWAFESSIVAKKDRFFIENIPVRIEFKNKARIEEILNRTEDNQWTFRQAGTYMFYRLDKGKVIIKKSEWIDKIRESLNKIPDSFWQLLITSSKAKMEHYLLDLNASVVKQDDCFYLISAAGFIKNFCSLLFALNHKFEPSGRRIYNQALALPMHPENFKGRFEIFLKEDPEFPQSRKREVAELLAKSIIHMV